MSRDQLTDRQRALLLYVATYIAQNGISPSIVEIQAARGYASTSTVAASLRKLERLGYLSREYVRDDVHRPKRRTWRVVGAKPVRVISFPGFVAERVA